MIVDDAEQFDFDASSPPLSQELQVHNVASNDGFDHGMTPSSSSGALPKRVSRTYYF